jgi:nucleotide-binding universal stress UspA family protein
MIDKCEVCGAHVPDAVVLDVVYGGVRRLFCSAGCADTQVRDVLPDPPPLPHTILVAVDGSGPSVRATEVAAALARAAKGRLRLLGAVDPSGLRALAMDPVAGTRFSALAEQVASALRDSTVAQLDRCRRFCERAGVPCTVVIETRPPLEAILDAAADVDLVVMGSRGRDALSSSSLGSHAQRVVTGTRTPVLVVH